MTEAPVQSHYQDSYGRTRTMTRPNTRLLPINWEYRLTQADPGFSLILALGQPLPVPMVPGYRLIPMAPKSRLFPIARLAFMAPDSRPNSVKSSSWPILVWDQLPWIQTLGLPQWSLTTSWPLWIQNTGPLMGPSPITINSSSRTTPVTPAANLSTDTTRQPTWNLWIRLTGEGPCLPKPVCKDWKSCLLPQIHR